MPVPENSNVERRMQQKSRETPTVTMLVTLHAVRRKINWLIQHHGKVHYVYYVSKANYVQKLKDTYPAEINFCNWNIWCKFKF